MEKSDISVEQETTGISFDSAKDSRLRGFLVLNCSRLTTIVYLIIALLLVFAIVLATIEAVEELIRVVMVDISEPESMSLHRVVEGINLNEAVSYILFIIVLATLIDLVRSYLKYGRVLVRPILVAGITTMVRRLLVWDTMTFAELLGVGIIILVLTFAIVFLGREDRRMAKFSKNQEYQEPAFPLFRKKNKHHTSEPEE